MIHCYYINLDRDTARNEWMASQLTKAGLDFTRVPAVAGATLDPAVIERHTCSADVKMTPNEIGCLHSHMTAWSLIVQRGDEFGLVMEDDVHLSPGLPGLLAQFTRPKDALELIKLDAARSMVDVRRSAVFNFPPYRGHVMVALGTNTGAYIISRKAAELLLQRCQDTQRPVDLAMYHDPATNHGITKIHLIPAPVQHDIFVEAGKRFQFGSSIGDRETFKPWAGRKRLKHRLRPLYHTALNLARLPRNIKRMLIPFQ
jgi:glycosyl transferase family 25